MRLASLLIRLVPSAAAALTKRSFDRWSPAIWSQATQASFCSQNYLLSTTVPASFHWQEEQHNRQAIADMPTAVQQQPAGQQQQQHQKDKQWTPQQEQYMSLAFEQARMALRVREVPIGCVIVRDGQVIGSGYNMTNHTRNATRHAELEAIDRILADHGGDAAKADFGRCQLYVTVEPCIMCAGALSLMGLHQVFYGAANDKFGGCGSIMQVHDSGCGCCSGRADEAVHGKPFEAHGGLFAEEAINLLQQFYVCGNPTAPKPKRAVVEVPPWQLQEAAAVAAVPGQQGSVQDTHSVQDPPAQPTTV